MPRVVGDKSVMRCALYRAPDNYPADRTAQRGCGKRRQIDLIQSLCLFLSCGVAVTFYQFPFSGERSSSMWAPE